MTCPNCDHSGKTLAPECYAELDAYIDALHIAPNNPRRKETLIQTLHKAQGIFGYLPEEVQRHIAQRYSIPHADVSGVISFYNYFTTTPKGGVQISVCLGTACYVNGAEKVLQEFERTLNIKAGEVSEDGSFSLECLRCVGACGLAPVVTVNDRVYGKVQPGKVKDILEQYLVEASITKEADHAKD
ncbi:MAG TPA: NAD(P)H-dependent oxidoreductase subunit E [Aggregatilinea sp.]|jgi:NADH:ubiquinone oxidoreductase subunit E|uniref:NADH-quinone oxidoreductase subunit NuoE family protein n=1 Tax=Aggregatilinea sp. TaxID=2806333 RepID=UPI002CADDD13|nr:NAD(P)H-dependent oxidoreductase subunit E [Aggregatilinea sp.]HML24318.1 NAD(P)H-dependent oxidoreductase subunit E [Aggregatilinea sp.]